jgi:hypothetical protein
MLEGTQQETRAEILEPSLARKGVNEDPAEGWPEDVSTVRWVPRPCFMVS